MRSKLITWLEKQFKPEEDLGRVSHAKLIDLNAAATRNWWYDKKGNRWPLRDSL